MRRLRSLTTASTARHTSEINITPLIDVVLVLLILFMVVTPLLEKDINVRLPMTAATTVIAPNDPLVVRVSPEGALTLNGDPVDAASYSGRLSALLTERKPGDRTVFVVADDSVNYGFLVSVIDRAKQAGADVVGMATDPRPEADVRSPAP